MGNIQADAEVGLDAVGGHHRAVSTDFLLHRVKADHGECGFLLFGGETSHHLSDNVTADAVIQSASDEALVCKLHRAILIDCGVADAETECSDL